jgi:aspartate 1-decarboxylase
MLLTALKAKIHRAKITETDIDYNGSISIDEDLLDASNIKNFEQVEIYNISNGTRFTTYALKAKRGSKKIGVNGAAARLVHRNDLIIICAYAQYNNEEIDKHQPNIILLNDQNEIIEQE